MTESRAYLQKYAMKYGTYMGIFWIVKFILFPLGFTQPILSLLFIILTLGVPFLAYFLVKKYREEACGGYIRFTHALVFTIFMFMFASLLVAVAHYIYFTFIDHGFILNSYTELWKNLLITTPGMETNKKIIEDTIETAQTLTPIRIVIQVLSWNVFWGTILAFPIAMALMKKDNSEQNKPTL